MNLDGLTSAQVAAKIKAGKVNKTPNTSTTSVGRIILKNTLTIFNFVNLILAILIIVVGSYKNLLFILIAIANTLIGIINSLRAKHTVDKMRLLAEQQPTVIRDGKSRQIPAEDLVEGDLMILNLGDQILADSEVVQGAIEVNESLLTGEQSNIRKTPGESLISGSFITSGSCKARITKVGEDSYVNKLQKSAHEIKASDSKLFHIINSIVKYISFALIPIGVLLLISRFQVKDTTPEVAVTSTVAALISMIPEGLVLLTSSVLALATIRLARKKILVQDLYSTETLARVDCICLDKTGTLTTGDMTVKDIIPATDAKPGTKAHTSAQNSLENALKLILSGQEADTSTSAALRRKLLKRAKFTPKEHITEVIPFSSDRKYSGIKTNKATYLMGALEFIPGGKIFTNSQSIKHKISDFGRAEVEQCDKTSNLSHCVTSGNCKNLANYRIISVVKQTKGKSELLGYVALEDELRTDAKEIIKFFEDNDVKIDIISGDNLETVTNIAKKVGVKDLRPVDLSSIKSPDYNKLVKDYNIFTRVKPSQKKSLIKALKEQKYTVAMTGDGVNDILAMKEADCSIAIGEGSDAARRSAKLVLLNSDFSAVPAAIAEGRQSINNLERSATLFLTKTTYASILAILFAINHLDYPFTPISMTLLNVLCIGLPGLILALEPNISRVKDRFTYNIKRYSIPTGVIISAAIIILSVIAKFNSLPRSLFTTLAVILVFALDFTLLYRISRPLNKLRAALLVAVLLVFVLALTIPLSRDFFEFYPFF